jgi:hypothetical protein
VILGIGVVDIALRLDDDAGKVLGGVIPSLGMGRYSTVPYILMLCYFGHILY